MKTEIEHGQRAATVDSNSGAKSENVDIEMKGDNISETDESKVEVTQQEDMIVDDDDDDDGEAHVVRTNL